MLHDRDIREPLFAFLEQRYGKIRILEEKTMGRSRADIVMVTPGELLGIEIKSDADGYTRLSRQVRDYDRYFDRNFCVVGVSHAAHIEEHLPQYWGIITAEALEDGSLDFYVAREPQPNPQMEEERKISLLWRRELNHLLSRNALPAYAGKSKKSVCQILLERVHPDELAWQLTDELFERDYTTIEQEISDYRAAHGVKPKGKRKRKKRTAKSTR
ncbi:MAG: sce7726 family protein [Clostridia bacterium]|nr:sce7726 family protein [Clostridia bacterium]